MFSIISYNVNINYKTMRYHYISSRMNGKKKAVRTSNTDDVEKFHHLPMLV